MPAHHRTRAVVVLAAAALVLATGCSAAQKAVDCARLGIEITNDADDLQRAVTDAADDPGKADRILDTLDKDTRKLKDKTDDTDVSKALDHLQKAVANVRDADRRNVAPDLTPVKDAAGELTKVCTPK
ncbi:hypothetical protein AF335_04335 [Streptomyces eurocidicus]|uniref:ABC-type transporter Mla subunit MlaD n=1 Tax=Streptomyces eurocidicus TaxID=66423 RepID=A0A2N8P3F1_STREU|nr:hypothetical protein [Streptomyces eurocidicus]MBB5117753.1 ABC-type transporter Mla subunit MlaD [Streptomyces eurocidicus]MBF6053587.1 hypothetical protein [Streptomyces eurocidicus]PNE35543.1 hypothetical protein AF335_04335 [Streptomyces eurocidicus]